MADQTFLFLSEYFLIHTPHLPHPDPILGRMINIRVGVARRLDELRLRFDRLRLRRFICLARLVLRRDFFRLDNRRLLFVRFVPQNILI